MKDTLRTRILDLTRVIDTSAEYTLPVHRLAGEQTLALYYIALTLAELRDDLKTGPSRADTPWAI
ncbi:MAG: hypothetical protein KGJ13_09825 [Patescibacteria group bacterium]|nr:hypothetical protein [Patescibacteria group bacterium]